MAVIRRVFCDICGHEDGNAYAWFLGPWTHNKTSDGVLEFVVCKGCISTVHGTVKGLFVEPKLDGRY